MKYWQHEQQGWDQVTGIRSGAVLCLVALIATIQQAVAEPLDLTGRQVFTATADHPDFARPEAPAGDWIEIEAPGSLRAQGIPPRTDVFWYRFSFELPTDWSDATPAIRLGNLDRADETYLNGERIGHLGLIGPRLTDWHAYPRILPRLYPFDPDLLRPGQENLLAIRMAREPYIDDGGIISGPVEMVSFADAFPEYTATLRRYQTFNMLFFGIECLLLIATLLIALGGRGTRTARVFLLPYLPYFLHMVERRGVLTPLGWEGQGLQFWATFVGGLAIPGLMVFTAHIFGHPLGRLGRVLLGAALVALINVPMTGIAWLDWWAIESTLVWHVILMAILVLLLVWSVRALVRRIPASGIILLGYFGLAAALMADSALSANFLEARFGFRLGEVGTLGLFMSYLAAVGQRYVQMQQALDGANAHLLHVHEVERARLAREVHDGIGQWLSTIKLRLEILRAEHKGDAEALTEIVSDVSAALNDSRQLAHDLSPALLEKGGLAAAMTSHSERLARVSDMQIALDIPPEMALPEAERHHVYRIFQEALTNAMRHSGASQVTVDVRQTRTRFVMAIIDNGHGSPDDTSAPGFGQRSLRERARLLGGRIEIGAGPGRGTSVVLDFPIEADPAEGAS